MDFAWSFEQRTFKESMRKFAEREVSPGIIERDLKGEFNWEAWKYSILQGLADQP